MKNTYLFCGHCKRLKPLTLKRKIYELIIANFFCEDCKVSTFHAKENGRWKRLKMSKHER